MGVNRTLWIVALLGMWAVPRSGVADTRYVVDTIVVNLREQPRNAANTVEHLKTGDSFEVLEAQGEYLKVRTPEGSVGWVKAQYVTGEKPKGMVIAELQAELARLRKLQQQAEMSKEEWQAEREAVLEAHQAEQRDLEARLARAEGEGTKAARELKETGAKYEALVKKSQQVIEIADERDRLQGEKERLAATLGATEAERDSLVRSAAVRWFLAGAGVFLGGWIAGSVSKKRKGRLYGK